jgi:hypothetical protein
MSAIFFIIQAINSRERRSSGGETMRRHVEGMLWAVSFLSLVVSAMMTTRAYLAVVACVWIVSSAVVIPLHFIKAWRRWPDLENKRQYAVWVGFEMTATIVLAGLFVYTMIMH